jgi:hypothetical protein
LFLTVTLYVCTYCTYYPYWLIFDPVVSFVCRDKKTGELKEPAWRDAPCGGQYRPSSNMPPTAYTPVLLRQEEEKEERVLQPMMWGLIPPWHHGPDPKGQDSPAFISRYCSVSP